MSVDVRTSAGTVRGLREDEVAVFRGAPLPHSRSGAAIRGAGTTGTVRRGQGVTEFGTPPPQPGRTTIGDDWLTLTVWTPSPGQHGSTSAGRASPAARTAPLDARQPLAEETAAPITA